MESHEMSLNEKSKYLEMLFSSNWFIINHNQNLMDFSFFRRVVEMLAKTKQSKAKHTHTHIHLEESTFKNF